MPDALTALDPIARFQIGHTARQAAPPHRIAPAKQLQSDICSHVVHKKQFDCMIWTGFYAEETLRTAAVSYDANRGAAVKVHDVGEEEA